MRSLLPICINNWIRVQYRPHFVTNAHQQFHGSISSFEPNNWFVVTFDINKTEKKQKQTRQKETDGNTLYWISAQLMSRAVHSIQHTHTDTYPMRRRNSSDMSRHHSVYYYLVVCHSSRSICMQPLVAQQAYILLPVIFSHFIWHNCDERADIANIPWMSVE